MVGERSESFQSKGLTNRQSQRCRNEYATVFRIIGKIGQSYLIEIFDKAGKPPHFSAAKHLEGFSCDRLLIASLYCVSFYCRWAAELKGSTKGCFVKPRMECSQGLKARSAIIPCWKPLVV
jgi:hypothetical protein